MASIVQAIAEGGRPSSGQAAGAFNIGHASPPTAGNAIIGVFAGRSPDGTVTNFSVNTEDGWILVGVASPMEAHTVGIAYKPAADGDATDDLTVTPDEDVYSIWIGLAETTHSGISEWVRDKFSVNGSDSSNVSSIATGSTGTLSSATGFAIVVGTSRTANEGLSTDTGSTTPLTDEDVNFVNDSGQANYLAAFLDLASTAALDATISESNGSSRMGAVIATFIEDAGGGVSQAIGQAVDTSVAQALAVAKTQGIAQAAETDTAIAITARKTYPIGLAAETDAAQLIASVKAQTIGLAIEADTAHPVSEPGEQTIAIGQAQESDVAQGVAITRAQQIAQVVETDLAQALDWLKVRTIAQVLEADTAHPVSEPGEQAIAIGQAVEQDLARALDYVKSLGIGQAVETDTAHSLTVVRAFLIGLATEIDLAQPLGRLKAFRIGQAIETDTALSVTVIGGLVFEGRVEFGAGFLIGVESDQGSAKAVESSPAGTVGTIEGT